MQAWRFQRLQLVCGGVGLQRPAGEIYEGAWLDGSWHGQGKHTSSDGEVCEGEWVDHEFLG